MDKKVFNIAIPAVIISVLSFIIIYKAAIMPATYDEVTTHETYTGFDKFIDIIFNKYDNSNNHILNSLLITVFQSGFGVKLWTLRLPNILSFFLFSGSVYVLAKRYFNGSLLLFCLPFFCLLLNPYLVDFFSLARGYGMANALMACSIVCLLLFSSSKKIKWYYLTILFATLAAYANFIFLMFWGAVQILLVTNLLFTNKFNNRQVKGTLAITVIAGLGFVLLCYIPVTSIQQCIRSQPGISKNFYYNTLLGEIDRFAYGKPLGVSFWHLSWLVIAVVLAAGVNCFLKIRKNLSSAYTDPFNLVYLLLIMVWAINILQVRLSDTNYLFYRTALIYYVLFMFVFIFLLREMVLRNVFGMQIIMGFISLVFVFHFVRCVNLTSVYEWSYDAYTCDVMDHIETYKQRHPEIKTVELNLTNSFRNSFDYYVQTNNLPWFKLAEPKDTSLLNNNVDTACQSLFYYTSAINVPELKNYTAVKKFTATGLMVPLPNAQRGQVLLMHK